MVPEPLKKATKYLTLWGRGATFVAQTLTNDCELHTWSSGATGTDSESLVCVDHGGRAPYVMRASIGAQLAAEASVMQQ